MYRTKLFPRMFSFLLFVVIAAYGGAQQQVAAQDKGKPEKTKIKIGMPVKALSFAPPLLAIEAGFYADEGITDVEVVTVAGLPAYAALKEGKMDAYYGGTDSFYRIAAETPRGEYPFIIAQTVVNSITMDTVFNKRYGDSKGVKPGDPLDKRVKAMKGGRWGTQSLGGSPHVMMSYLAKQYGGLDPEKDMEFVAMRQVPATVAATKAGQIDGYMLSPPSSLLAEVEGWGYVMIPASDVGNFQGVPHESLVLSKKYVEKYPNTVLAIIRAGAKARRMLATDPPASARQLQKVFPSTPSDLLTRAVKWLQFAFRDDPGWEDQSMIDKHIGVVVKAGMLKTRIEFKEGVHWTNELIEKATGHKAP